MGCYPTYKGKRYRSMKELLSANPELQKTAEKEEFFSLSSSDSNVEKYRSAVVLDKNTNTYTFIDSVANKVVKGLQRITSYVKKDQGPELAGAQSDAQYVGTMVHEYVEYAVSQLVNELGGYAAVKPINIPAEHTEIVKNLKKQLTPFITQVIKNGGKIHLELPIANLKKRIAGTLDMLVEWPDGTGHIYDFKTFGYRTEADLNKGIKQSTIDKTYDPQINEYVQALEQGMPELGIKPIKISNRRIIPIPVYREKDILLDAQIDTGLSDDADLSQMFKPVPSERTGDRNLDMVLDRLARHKKILSDKLRATDKENVIKIEELEAKIESISKQMEDIQLSLQVDETVEGISNLLKAIDQDCELGHFDFDLDYQEAMDIINIAEVLTTKLSLQEMRPDETEEEFEKRKEDRMKLHGQAGMLKTTINEYRDKFLEKTAENTGIADLVKSLGKGLFDANRASGWFRRLFLGISSASHPLIASLKRLIDHAIFKVNQRFAEIHNSIESELDLLYKASGTRSQSVFEPFLQYYNGKRTGNLVAEYKLDFFIKRKEAFRDNDLEWIEDNLELDEEKINEAIAKKIEEYRDEALAFEVDDIDDYVSKKKESYREYLSKKPYNYKPKNPDTWLDPKYKTIMSTPHLKRFYTFYTEMMQELSKGLPINNRGNFLPSFKQDYLDAISQYGLTNYAKNFFNASVSFGAFQTGQNDPDFGLYDPRTGESIPGIPVPGNNSDISSTEKSYDLGKVLSRFAHGSLTYKHMKEVETAALVTLDYVRDEEFEEVGLITGEPTGKKNKDVTTYGYLKDYIDNVLYGKKREPGAAFKGKSGKAYSLVKVGDWLLQKVAVKALGVNPFTPATNFIGGNVNLFALASAGKYYGLGDLASAYKEVAANNAKARALVEHFQVLMQDQKFREHLKLSNNSFAQAFTLDKLLIGMEGTDWMMQAANFIAMLKSGKYKFNWDSYDLVDGKLVWKGQGAEPTSQELSGFSAKAKFVAGTMLGNMNDNDRMAAKKWFLGRAVIMFRGWLPQMLHTRFKRKDYDYVTERFTEGAYVTFTREIVGKVLFNAFKLRMDLAGKALKEMTSEDRKNVKLVFTEMALAALLLIAVKLLTGFGDDDEDESMFENYVEVVLSRGFAEATFFMDPTTSSMRQILKDPIVANKAIDDFSGLIVNTWDMTFTDNEHASEKAFKSLLKQFPITSTGLNTYERLK